MFGAKQLSLNRDTGSVVALTPNIKLAAATKYCLHYLRGTSGSIPRSIFAIRSWWLRIIFTTTMTPPITMAEMGIRNGPKPKTESKNLFTSPPRRHP
jgi:hypothetical protein